jgi:hypothetical protein
MTNEFLLTTIDNPFDPFTQWNEWKRLDEDMGYFTCNYLARIAKTSDDLSDADMIQAIDDAIDEIVKLNINGMYRKIYRQDVLPGGEG